MAIHINNDLFYLDLLKFFMPYMPRSDINETEESPFAYVELSHVIARNGMPRLRLNGVMGLPIATISTGNNDLPGALPHKCYLSSCWVSSPFLYQSASAAFASPSELFFPSHLPPIGFKLLKPRSPSHPHLFHSPPLLIPQLPSPSPSPPPVRLVTISSSTPSSTL